MIPTNPLKSPRFGDVVTFNRLPWVRDLEDLKSAAPDVVLLGVPFDGGTTFRPGSRFGPRAIREASVLNRNYHPTHQVDVFEKLRVVDGGDILVNPLNLQVTYRNIESHLSQIHAFGARSVCVGGDHSILLPELRSVHKKFGQVTLIQFDAHTDTADGAWEEKYHHGTPVRRAIEEGLVRGDHVFQIGIRGPLTSATQNDFIRDSGINVLEIDEFFESKKRAEFLTRIKATAQGGPCFLTFDVDGVDPAFAPGTGTPVVGGMSSYDALRTLRELRGLHFVGADVVEVSPPYDHAEITALLGAAVVFEALGLMVV